MGGLRRCGQQYKRRRVRFGGRLKRCQVNPVIAVVGAGFQHPCEWMWRVVVELQGWRVVVE